MGREHFISLSKKRRRWRYLYGVIAWEVTAEEGVLASYVSEKERRAFTYACSKLSCDMDADSNYLRDPQTLAGAARKLLKVVERPARPSLNQRGWLHWSGEPPSPEQEQTILYAELASDLRQIIETCEEAERHHRAVYWIVSD